MNAREKNDGSNCESNNTNKKKKHYISFQQDHMISRYFPKCNIIYEVCLKSNGTLSQAIYFNSKQQTT